MSAEHDQHLAGEVIGRLFRLAHAMDQDATRRLRSFGLTVAQYQLLLQIRQRPGTLQQEVGDRLGVTKGNISMLVTRLEAEGLLLRAPDGAANRLDLTPRGHDLLRTVVPEQARWTSRQFAGLSPSELDELARLLRALQS